MFLTPFLVVSSCGSTLIEVVLRNMRSQNAYWRQKTPLTNGQVQEAPTHCLKISEPLLPLGWKSTPRVQWTVAHCEALLQKHRNLYVFSSMRAEHRHKPFKLAVKNGMCGWCLRRLGVSRRGLTHVLNVETLDVGLRHRAVRQRLALGEATRDGRKRRCITLEKTNFNPVDAYCALLAKIHGAETPPRSKGAERGF